NSIDYCVFRHRCPRPKVSEKNYEDETYQDERQHNEWRYFPELFVRAIHLEERQVLESLLCLFHHVYVQSSYDWIDPDIDDQRSSRRLICNRERPCKDVLTFEARTSQLTAQTENGEISPKKRLGNRSAKFQNIIMQAKLYHVRFKRLTF